MFPVLIDLGTVDLPWIGPVDLILPTYGVLFAAGALLAWWWFVRRGRTLGVPEDKLFNLCFYSLLAGLLGAKLLLILLDLDFYLSHPRELLGSIRSAGVLMGGVLGGIVAFVFYCRRHGLPLLRLGDAIAAPLALAQAIGRLGCFSAGCCYGVEAAPGNPFANTFTDPHAGQHTGVTLGVPLVPTQLMQFGSDLLLTVILTVLWRRRSGAPGTVFWWYLVLYGVGRGAIEFWRGDVSRGVYFGEHVSTSQILSLAAIAIGILMLIRARRDAPLNAA